MMDPEVQRLMHKFWHVFESSHTGYVPYHEVVAFELLVCKGASAFPKPEVNKGWRGEGRCCGSGDCVD